MAKTILFSTLAVFFLFLAAGDALAQTTAAAIKVEPMSPHRLGEMGFENPNEHDNVTTGLPLVGKGTRVFLSGWDVSDGQNYAPGADYLWELLSKPAGSAAVLDSTTTQWTTLHTDSAGTYSVRLTIGGVDTSVNIVAANFIGVDRHDVGGGAFNCKTCHSSVKPEVYAAWSESGHAKKFEKGMNGDNGSYWGQACFKCHTTGFNLSANNGGFDEVQQAVGFVDTQWMPWRPGLYDSLLTTDKKTMTLLSGIGCEQCHGPKNPAHAGPGTQPKTMKAEMCGQCHDEPWRHNFYSMWSNSGHANPPWSGSYDSDADTLVTNYTLDACIRCHDGGGFVAFTKGEPFDNRISSGYSKLTRSEMTCQTCHNPHSTELRVTPPGSDTLANGYSYAGETFFGKGKLCTNCHKYRREPESYIPNTRASSFRGPHHRGATDVFLGQNGYTFGQEIPISIGHRLVDDLCVGCHMSPTPDTGSVARDQIGGHSWNMEYEGPDSVEYNNITKCVECHTGITSYEDIVAAIDYDKDGTLEPFMHEVNGLLDMIAMQLPPFGSTDITRALIGEEPDSVFLKQVYWNYLYVEEDHSHGVHNPKYVIGLLQTTVNQLTGIDFSGNEPLPAEYVLTQNYPNPFNPTTTFKVGMVKSGEVRVEVFNVLGARVATLMDGTYAPGVYQVSWDGRDGSGKDVAGGIYIYRMQTAEFSSVKKMILLK